MENVNKCYSAIGVKLIINSFSNIYLKNLYAPNKFGPMKESASVFPLSHSESSVLVFSPGNLSKHDSSGWYFK